MLNYFLFKYRVIQEEKSIFCEMIVSVIMRKKVHIMSPSNSEWLARQNFLNLQIQKHCEW